MICPICYSESDREFQRHTYWIRECKECGHRFAEILPSSNHVQDVYGDHYFQGRATGYPDYFSEGKLITARGREYARLLSKYMRPGSVLDVGAAAGFILKGFIDSGWRGIGIEPNACIASYARANAGVHVETCTLEQFRSSDRYDLVSMIQVIGHFVDVRRALEVAAQVTTSGGFWLVETWDRESFVARAFGRYWHEYNPPSVLHWFTPNELQHLALHFGFHEVDRGRPVRWINGTHAKSLLRHNLAGSRIGGLVSSVLNIVPDHMSIPYPPADLFWVLFEKL